eukprot:6062463-Amphidinium_carterae.1
MRNLSVSSGPCSCPPSGPCSWYTSGSRRSRHTGGPGDSKATRDVLQLQLAAAVTCHLCFLEDGGGARLVNIVMSALSRKDPSPSLSCGDRPLGCVVFPSCSAFTSIEAASGMDKFEAFDILCRQGEGKLEAAMEGRLMLVIMAVGVMN